MSTQTPCQQAGDKLKKALCALSELVQQYPDKSRTTLLRQVEIQFDLSPKECDFLNKHFDDLPDCK
ncbi:MAG: hypothetical protein H8E79_02050 [Desulfobulbaceae bacterium]|uniref:Uncharacterized protein n=1 Tax=Candidatus Desulfatifera sulfidica TaxID=2841691 RepID=A0A8J6N5I5_9BACT|nr:hypothetical protein [Candidatus Desulfatifera sulfidica]